MEKLRVMTGAFGALALAAVFAVGFTALVTPAADASQCFCSQPIRTSLGWGMGATCTEARNNCWNDAYGNADATCQGISGGDACWFGSISYSDCYPFGGAIKVDCYLQVRCEACVQYPD
jgi:hypothetical protein